MLRRNLGAKALRMVYAPPGSGERVRTEDVPQADRMTALRDTPWYVTGAFLSAPLHFGDYGSLPMKIIWTLLDVATILVLVTGLVLWRRRPGPEFEPA